MPRFKTWSAWGAVSGRFVVADDASRTKSCCAVVLEILGKNKKGFTLADLAVKVNESGYRSTSRNFRNVLYQCLYNTEGITHDDATGCYRLER